MLFWTLIAVHCLFFLLQTSVACHFLVKGIAATLRENVCYSKRELRQSLNRIIHCPYIHTACKDNMKHQAVIFHPESLEFIVKSGLYRDIQKIKIVTEPK